MKTIKNFKFILDIFIFVTIIRLHFGSPNMGRAAENGGKPGYLQFKSI